MESFVTFLIISLVIILLVTIYVFKKYNRMQGSAQAVKEKQANIMAVMKTRTDLANKLIDIATSYGEHEKLTHITVTQAENSTAPGGAAIDNVITQVSNLARNYPELKANETYQKLMADLKSIEEALLQRRESYNAVVREYNTQFVQFPFVLIAGKFGFISAPYFDVDDSDALEKLKSFVTNDGEYLKNALQGVSKQVAESTKKISHDVKETGRLVYNKSKDEIEKIRKEKTN